MSNSLAKVHPELVSEWSDKNLPLTPETITFGSNKKVWWKGTCGHEWQTSVKARSKGESCPICSGARVIAGINDLATLQPLLAQEWADKNDIQPTEVSVGSHKKVIWRCEKGHEWEASETRREPQAMETLKEHLCNKRGIKLIRIPWKPNETETEYAERVKGAFKKAHIFIGSDTEKDVEYIRHRFTEWRKSR